MDRGQTLAPGGAHLERHHITAPGVESASPFGNLLSWENETPQGKLYW